ncbi:hypothetical protein [Ramlibacter albus]|uniref:Uncharacterized protein n=1 Tax=Ramlibacter albus TaxID=2079448 RepID=A0A923M676_9BURK|nr:hypothetical protein [Ramlibacter albus]MBC5763322.1 hypothetical protein [Ramlibacter albus]
MLYYFHQIEVEPLSSSRLAIEMPQASGAFVNSIVDASSEPSAREKLHDALQVDGYTVPGIEGVQVLDGVVDESCPEL